MFSDVLLYAYGESRTLTTFEALVRVGCGGLKVAVKVVVEYRLRRSLSIVAVVEMTSGEWIEFVVLHSIDRLPFDLNGRFVTFDWHGLQKHCLAIIYRTVRMPLSLIMGLDYVSRLQAYTERQS